MNFSKPWAFVKIMLPMYRPGQFSMTEKQNAEVQTLPHWTEVYMDSSIRCDTVFGCVVPAFTHTQATSSHSSQTTSSQQHHPLYTTTYQLNATTKPNILCSIKFIINLFHCTQSPILLACSLLFITAYLMKRNKQPQHHNTVLSYTVLSVDHSGP